MSWFFGAVGNISEADRLNFAAITSKEVLLSHSSEHLLLAAGGIKETCIYHSAQNASGFVVCGKAISSEVDDLHFITANQWKAMLSSGAQLQDLNGHFAGIHWTNDRCFFFTDTLGLRDITLYKRNDVLYFTTSEAYLPKLTGTAHEIDWRTFSGRWTLTNQLSLESTLLDTIRLVSGATAIYDNRLTVHRPPKAEESVPPQSGERIARILKGFISLPNAERQKLHVALSAGMDSRLILSYLLSNQHSDYKTYTFEDPKHPEALVMTQMVFDLKFPHTIISTELPTDDSDLIVKLRTYLVQKKVTTNSAHFIDSLPYDRFRSTKNGVLIDGGFGEIGRRRLYERLRIRNKKELLSNDPRRIYSLFKRDRADVFNRELTNSISAYAQEQVIEYIEQEIPPASIGIDQWLDRMAVRAVLPNFNAFEQSRLDGIIANLCPFTQPVFISAILACSVDLRRNARLYRDIIAGNSPQLRKYPLVKFEATYPYRFSAASAFLWTSAKRKLGRAFVSNNRIDLLRRLEPFIKDTASSQSVKEVAAYDSNKVQHIITNFYAGKDEYAHQLDWWLSFELWRQSLTP